MLYLSLSVETQLQKLRVWSQQLFYKCSRQLGVYLLNNLHTKRLIKSYILHACTQLYDNNMKS